VLIAVAQNGLALKFASDKLKSDIKVVHTALSNQGDALEYATKELRDSKETVLIAIGNNTGSFEFASDRLRADKGIVLEALTEGSAYDVYNSVPKSLAYDNEVLLMVAAGICIHYTESYYSEQIQTEIAHITKDHYDKFFAYVHMLAHDRISAKTLMIASLYRTGQPNTNDAIINVFKLFSHGPHFAKLLKNRILSFVIPFQMSSYGGLELIRRFLTYVYYS